MSPQRIQLRRTKGWRKPEGAIVVSRPSKWGNPFKAGAYVTTDQIVERYRAGVDRHWPGFPTADEIREHLAGHDLACWCPLDQPCHADVLLEIANQPP